MIVLDRKTALLYQGLTNKTMMLTEKEVLMYILKTYEANINSLYSIKKQMYDLNRLLLTINNDEQKTSFYRKYKRAFLHFKKLDFMIRTYYENFTYLLNNHLKCEIRLKQTISLLYEELKDNIIIMQQDTNSLIEEIKMLISYVIGYRNTYKVFHSEYEKRKKVETIYYKSIMLDKKDDFKRYGEIRRILIAVNKKLQEANQKWISSGMKLNHADDVLRHFYDQ